MRLRLARAVTVAVVAVTIVAFALSAIAITVVARRPLPQNEADRLVALLNDPRERAVAEIGAGSGALTVAVARKLGGTVTVYSTELDTPHLAAIWLRAVATRTWNVKVVQGVETETKLPAGCCDAVFMRRVYHHFMKPSEMDASLFKTVRPGGLLVVIDQEPKPWTGGGILPSRGGDGIRPVMLITELGDVGFRHLRTINPWNGDLYVALFEKPR